MKLLHFVWFPENLVFPALSRSHMRSTGKTLANIKLANVEKFLAILNVYSSVWDSYSYMEKEFGPRRKVVSYFQMHNGLVWNVLFKT